MSLFATLLPGVRALRAPLASGYLTLIALWLVYSDDAPDRDAADGIVEQFFDLEGAAPDLWTGIAVSFLAYLIGTLTEWGTTSVLRATVSSRFRSLDRWVEHETLPTLARKDGIDIGAARHLLRKESFGRRWRRRELSGIRTTLMVEHPLLYNEYDRLTSEAEFRTAIALPLGWVLAILAMEFDSAFFGGLFGVAALVAQAVQYEKEGTAVLVQSVIGGTVSSPFVESVRRRAQQ